MRYVLQSQADGPPSPMSSPEPREMALAETAGTGSPSAARTPRMASRPPLLCWGGQKLNPRLFPLATGYEHAAHKTVFVLS